MNNFLEVNGLHASYGTTPALRNASLRVGQGELVCIVGQNGAGKSTLLNAVAGGLSPRGLQGSVMLNGQEIIGMSPERIARMGVSLVPEGRHVFGDMTVLENLRIGAFARHDRGLVMREIDEVFGLFPRLYERRNQPSGLLSGGEQQMLVIGRGVMTNAQLLLIDEPSLGLAPKVIEDVYTSLVKLQKERGLTLLINEQSSNRVLRYADRFYVLRAGQIRLQGKPSDLSDPQQIREAYFGVTENDAAHNEQVTA